MRWATLWICTGITLFILTVKTAIAGPTSQIVVPSTDVVAFKKLDLGIDNYFRSSGDSEAAPNASVARDPNTLDISLTAGVLPFAKAQMEIGCDYQVNANNPNDQHPWSGNFKLATPEGAWFAASPALAVGLYNARPAKGISSHDAPGVTAGQNILYGLVAENIPALGKVPALGRFSAGYYRGAARALVNGEGEAANTGLLLSWDRAMKEISERLWLGVDYQGGNNSLGAVSVGLSWGFAENVSLLFGYNMYMHRNLAGSNSFTTQLDLILPK